MSDTTQNEPSAFDTIKSESTAVQARFDAGTQTILAHAASMGVELSETDVEHMAALRIYALGGDSLTDNAMYEREILSIPAIAAQKRKDAMAEEILAGRGAAHDELMRMSPAERMTFARSQNLMGGGGKQERVTADTNEERLAILLAMPPAARIAQARAWGMTGQE
tara:strand:+ start:503 stop:1000 length:498 start_codon:yes stop_codon:yes gene_type:complete